jgi:signal transduction histidine kinase
LILAIFRSIGNLGTGLVESDSERIRIKRTNYLTLVTFVVVLVFFFDSLMSGKNLRALSQLGVLVLFILPTFRLNHLGKFKLARLTLITGTILTTLFDAASGGRVEGHHYFFNLLAIGSVMIFRPSDSRWILSTTGLILATWLATECWFFGDTRMITVLNIVLSFCICTGITWRFAIQVAKSEKLSRQRAKISALGEMAAGMGHEINNPLTIISVSSELLLLQATCNPRNQELEKELLLRIRNSTVRISKIVEALKKFSRSSERDPFLNSNLAEIIQTSIQLCQHRSGKDAIQIKFECSKSISISCRESELIQVFVNLLSNAMDAVARLDEKWIEIAVAEVEDEIKISITDSGDGISKKISDKIMQPFFTTKEVGSGSGLGLSISLGLIEGHGGSLRLDRSFHKTRFVIQLPRAPDSKQVSNSKLGAA